MMGMTARQIRAYLKAAVKIRARECLEEATIASIHAMEPKAAQRLMDAWYLIIHPDPEMRFVEGKFRKMLGSFEVLEGETVLDIFKKGGH